MRRGIAEASRACCRAVAEASQRNRTGVAEAIYETLSAEPEGESINDSEKGSGDEEDQKEVVEEEDDDSFLVPHGYLSDDELDEEIREVCV